MSQTAVSEQWYWEMDNKNLNVPVEIIEWVIPNDLAWVEDEQGRRFFANSMYLRPFFVYTCGRCGTRLGDDEYTICPNCGG